MAMLGREPGMSLLTHLRHEAAELPVFERMLVW